jgi:thiol-disulfide isomerase/thioredoxin
MVDFGKQKFTKLNLTTTLVNNIKQSYPGKTVDGSNWEFNYPDSLYDFVKYFDINDKNRVDTVANIISFSSIVSNDTLVCSSCYFSRGNVLIKSTFYKEIVDPEAHFLNNDAKDAIRTEYRYCYLLKEDADMELLASIEAAANLYSFFYVPKNDRLAYEKCLEKYKLLSEKYPDACGLLAYLAARSNYYYSKKDLKSVYDVFSNQAKNSYFGKEIKRNLDTDSFENMQLQAWNSGKYEPIVTDTNKFSLVIFSASWCKPCHEQIPLVEAISDKLGDKINIVYISIDETATVKDWNNMMRKGEIPGRSLLALDQMAKVRNKYFVLAIPYSFLVYPKGKSEVIDVRLTGDRDKLYRLVKK